MDAQHLCNDDLLHRLARYCPDCRLIQAKHVELSATQARVQLRDVHRRIGHTISTMRLRNVISDGEASPVEQSLERLLGAALNEIEQQLGHGKTDK